MSASAQHRYAGGFSLVEIMISLGCASLALLALVSLTLVSNRAQNTVAGNQEAIEQRAEIRALLFQRPRGTTAESCLSRLGTLTSPIFDPAEDFELSNLNYNASSTNVVVNKTYLTRPVLISPAGSSPIYSVHLMVEQSLREGQSLNPLPRSLLGSMHIQVDGSSQIIGCNWDISPSSIAGCTGIAGMSSSGATPTAPCYNDFGLATVGSCPYGTSFDTSASTCVPANMGCTQDSVPHNFDGTKFDCTIVPPVYAVIYPGAYSPPQVPPPSAPAPAPAPAPPSTPATPPTQPIPLPPNQAVVLPPSGPPAGGSNVPFTPPNPTPPPMCACGSTQLTGGSNQLCVRAYTNSEGFGNYDDMYEVKICNTVGALVAANPTHYFNEDGHGDSWAFRPGTCILFSGFKNENGLRYNRGQCL